MPQRHEPDQIREVIWSLMGEHSGARIAAMLKGDEVGLGRSIDMSKRTVERRIAELREERGDPPRYVEPGQELEAAQTIHRTFLSLVMLELKGVATAEDKRKRLRELGPAVRIAIESAKPASPSTRQSRGGKAKARSASPRSTLDQIGQEMRRQPASPSPRNGEPSSDASEADESRSVDAARHVHGNTRTSNGQRDPASSHA